MKTRHGARVGLYHFLGAALLAGGGTIACGGHHPSPETPGAASCPAGQVFDGRYCVFASSSDAGTATPPDAGTGATVSPGGATYTSLPQARQLDASASTGAGALLSALAASEAPGSKPVGPPLAGQFDPQQALEANVELAPGKCYTAVAAGAPSIENLDVKLVLPAWFGSGSGLVMAEDKTTGAQAVIGSRGDCYRWAAPTAGTIRLVLVVSRGNGIAAARLYER